MFHPHPALSPQGRGNKGKISLWRRRECLFGYFKISQYPPLSGPILFILFCFFSWFKLNLIPSSPIPIFSASSFLVILGFSLISSNIFWVVFWGVSGLLKITVKKLVNSNFGAGRPAWKISQHYCRKTKLLHSWISQFRLKLLNFLIYPYLE